MDHVIVTNFEGDIALYRGPVLPDLIRIVLRDELDLTAEDLDPPNPDYVPEALEAFRNPTLENLRQVLEAQEIDLIHSGPEE